MGFGFGFGFGFGSGFGFGFERVLELLHLQANDGHLANPTPKS